MKEEKAEAEEEEKEEEGSEYFPGLCGDRRFKGVSDLSFPPPSYLSACLSLAVRLSLW